MSDNVNQVELTEEQLYKIYRTLYDIIGEKYGVHINFTLEKNRRKNNGRNNEEKRKK